MQHQLVQMMWRLPVLNLSHSNYYCRPLMGAKRMEDRFKFQSWKTVVATKQGPKLNVLSILMTDVLLAFA